MKLLSSCKHSTVIIPVQQQANWIITQAILHAVGFVTQTSYSLVGDCSLDEASRLDEESLFFSVGFDIVVVLM